MVSNDPAPNSPSVARDPPTTAITIPAATIRAGHASLRHEQQCKRWKYNEIGGQTKEV